MRQSHDWLCKPAEIFNNPITNIVAKVNLLQHQLKLFIKAILFI
jgi:hypothetical protein